MAEIAMIMGESGRGKTSSLRNLNPNEVILIQTAKKLLPFPRGREWKPWDAERKSGQIIVSDNYLTMQKVIRKAGRYGKKIVVVDDFQYLMANEFMRRAHETGYGKFTEIAQHAWEVIVSAQSLEDEVNVYFLTHTETNDSGIKVKTIGKMLDEKITLEGMFPIVMRSVVEDGSYFFTTQNSGCDTVKTPMGMFEKSRIENDLAIVDKAIREYGA